MPSGASIARNRLESSGRPPVVAVAAPTVPPRRDHKQGSCLPQQCRNKCHEEHVELVPCPGSTTALDHVAQRTTSHGFDCKPQPAHLLPYSTCTTTLQKDSHNAVPPGVKECDVSKGRPRQKPPDCREPETTSRTCRTPS